MSTTISASNTHDLWVEARQFSITIARPSPTTISLTVTYPSTLTISDGCVVLLSSSPIAVPNYPVDGTLYNASTDWNAPADLLVPPDGAHVVGMYSALQGNPMPAQIIDTVNLVTSFTITITTAPPTSSTARAPSRRTWPRAWDAQAPRGRSPRPARAARWRSPWRSPSCGRAARDACSRGAPMPSVG